MWRLLQWQNDFLLLQRRYDSDLLLLEGLQFAGNSTRCLDYVYSPRRLMRGHFLCSQSSVNGAEDGAFQNEYV